jgi:hypothetical protein
VRHIDFMLAGAAAWTGCMALAGAAIAQPIPDPARPPAILDPGGEAGQAWRGSLGPGEEGPGTGGSGTDDEATPDPAGETPDGGGAPSRVREIETPAGAREAGAAPPSGRERGAAASGETDGPVFVAERQRQEFEPAGLRAGTFIITARAQSGLEVSDNVFATSTGRESDVLAVVRPSFTARSDWTRHELVLAYEGEYGAYREFSSENPADTALSAAGRVDVDAVTSLSAEAAFAREIEGRGSPEVSDAATSPTVRRAYGIAGTAARRLARITAALRGGIEVAEFADGRTAAGTLIDNGDRDRTETSLGGRLGFELSGAATVYGEGEYVRRDFDRAFDDDGFARDARRVGAVAGAALAPRAPIRAEIEIGLVNEDLADARLESLNELVVNAAASWAVTPITTLSGGFETEVEPTTVAGASGAVARRLSAGIDHEVRRDLVVRTALSHEWMGYPGATLEEETTIASLDGELWVSREAAILAGYAHERQTTNDGTGTVVENVYALGFRLQR